MRISAMSFLMLSLNFAATIPLVTMGFVHDDRELLLLALGLIGSGLVFLVIYRISGSSARCSLCSNPVLFSKRCSRNRNARRTMGSYRVRVATSIVFTNRFTCPYCGERTLCKAKQRPTDPPMHQQTHY